MLTMSSFCSLLVSLWWLPSQDGYLSYFRDQEEAEGYRSKDGSSQFHHHPSSQRQLLLDCVEAVRTEVRYAQRSLPVLNACIPSLPAMLLLSFPSPRDQVVLSVPGHLLCFSRI